MEAADGMLLRMRLPGGVIGADGLRTVAEVAERFGSGVVELTVRANLQIRGVAPVDVAAAGDRLVLAGLALADPVRDERRDVIGSPLAGHDPTELVDLSGVLADVADRLAADTGLDGLPPKFGVVLDGGGTASVRRIPADVALGAVRSDDGRTILQVELGRALDHDELPTAWISIADAVPVVLTAARLAAGHGERLAPLVDRIGRDAVVDLVAAGTTMGPDPDDPAGADERSAIDSPTTGNSSARPGPWADDAAASLQPVHIDIDTGSDIGSHTDAFMPTAARPAPIGVSRHRDSDRVNIGTAPFLGRSSPAALRSIAGLAQTTGASVRLTPWRGLVLACLPRSQRSTVTSALAAAGFSSDPDDPAHLVSACVGLPGCASSTADTQAAARALLDGAPPTARIHLSGCEKRCGADADHVVVADGDGRFRVGTR
jgi:precorrin-3B synthase